MRRHSVLLLVLAVSFMVVLGIVMLYSTGAYAKDARGDSFFFLKRQLMWLGIGFVACLIASHVDYHFWQKTWWIWLALSVVLLALCFIPPIGKRINGSNRWITLGFSNFQPSELAKLAVAVFLAWWFSRHEASAGKFRKGFAYPMMVVSVLLGLIAMEADIGTTALIGCAMVLVLFIAGTHIAYLGSMVIAGLAAVGTAIVLMPERMGRFLAFLDPEKYPADAYQTLQGLIAFGSGGITGLGLGNGRQKLSYLPFAHTDFIFPMVGEELGLVFTLLVVLSYAIVAVAGTLMVLRARDRFGLLLGFALLTMICLQAIVNIGVTTSLLPNKGMPLPFISYGGSNLLFCLLSVGILINIFRQGLAEKTMMPAYKMRARTTPRI